MRKTTAALLGALACVLWAAWFFTNYEKVVTEETISYVGEARFNDFLAAEMLLDELGIEADSRSSISPSDWLPDAYGTLLTRVTTSIAVESEREILAEWVRNGGYLIVLPPKQKTRLADDFLEYFGFRLVEAEAEEGNNGQDADNETEEESYSYSVDLDNTQYRIELSQESADPVNLSDTLGIVAARRAWGNGYVSVFASPTYFANDSIDTSDHARLLLDTVAGHVNSENVWFIYDATFPTLLSIIWKNAPYVVIGLTATLLLWLWSVMPVIGPKVKEAPPVRRSITEHLRAAGHFEWRHLGASSLFAASAAAVIHEAESRHPGIGRQSALKQAELIAKVTGRSTQAVLDILVNRDERRQREFTQNMQLLQTIRREL